MRPVSTWKGRLKADDPRNASGWKVRAYTRVVTGDWNDQPQTTGYVETTTGDQGRFVLAPIAVGGLQLDEGAALVGELRHGGDRHTERGQDDDVFRPEEVAAFLGIGQKADARGAKPIVDMRVVDDFARE